MNLMQQKKENNDSNKRIKNEIDKCINLIETYNVKKTNSNNINNNLYRIITLYILLHKQNIKKLYIKDK